MPKNNAQKNILVLFWKDSDQFHAVLARNPAYSIEEQCRQYEKDNSYPAGSFYAEEDSIRLQSGPDSAM